MRLSRLAAFLAACLLVPALLPSSAAFHDPAPLLDEHTIEGPFWFAWRVSVGSETSVVSFELNPPESEDRLQTGYGLWTMRVGQEKPHLFVVGTGGTKTTEAHAKGDEPVPHDVSFAPVVGSSGATNGFALTHKNLAPGDYWLVIVNTAPWQTLATIRLFGSEGVALVASDHGDEGTLLRESEFETDEPYHHVRTGALTVSAQAHHVRNASASYEAKHSLFGIFTLRGGEVRESSRERPDGTRFTSVVHSFVLSGEPAGRHTFRIDAWDVAPRAAAGPDAYALLLVADVRLPGPA